MLHSISLPARQPAEHSPVIVLLHGRGADEHDLFGLKEMLDPRFTIHSLRAPFEFEWGGYAWFDLFDDGTVDERSFEQSRNEILAFLETLGTQEVYLLGFSMGAIMSYSIALTRPGSCKGIAALSGFAPLQLEQDYRLDRLNDLRIFISHGTNDPVIPVTSARRTKELLSASTAQVVYREYAMGHQINDECLADLRQWFSDSLSPSPTV